MKHYNSVGQLKFSQNTDMAPILADDKENKLIDDTEPNLQG